MLVDTGMVDLAFVIDSSGSIRNSRFRALTEYIAKAVETTLEVSSIQIW